MSEHQELQEVDVEANPSWWADPVNIHQAILNVMREVTYLQKRQVRGVPWKAVLEEDVLDAFRFPLIRNRLTFRVTDTELVHTQIFDTGDGDKVKQAFRSIVKVRFRFSFCGVAEVEDIDGCVLSEAHSFAGMSVAAAMTMAVKYALRETFLLRTGSDPDVVPPSTFERTKPRSQQAQQPQADEADKFSEASRLITSSGSVEVLDKRIKFIRSKGVPRGFERQFDEICKKQMESLSGVVTVFDGDSETPL